MSPRPPSPNDVVLLKMLTDEGGVLTAGQVDARVDQFETKMRMTSQPGRYFLEKARQLGWVERVFEGTNYQNGQKRVLYRITDKGREDAVRYLSRGEVAERSNGHQTIG